ncbi:MAG: hypothetical protein MHM6MM_007406 [Cercozoa sp. M6MM]
MRLLTGLRIVRCAAVRADVRFFARPVRKMPEIEAFLEDIDLSNVDVDVESVDDTDLLALAEQEFGEEDGRASRGQSYEDLEGIFRDFKKQHGAVATEEEIERARQEMQKAKQRVRMQRNRRMAPEFFNEIAAVKSGNEEEIEKKLGRRLEDVLEEKRARAEAARRAAEEKAEQARKKMELQEEELAELRALSPEQQKDKATTLRRELIVLHALAKQKNWHSQANTRRAYLQKAVSMLRRLEVLDAKQLTEQEYKLLQRAANQDDKELENDEDSPFASAPENDESAQFEEVMRRARRMSLGTIDIEGREFERELLDIASMRKYETDHVEGQPLPPKNRPLRKGTSKIKGYVAPDRVAGSDAEELRSRKIQFVEGHAFPQYVSQRSDASRERTAAPSGAENRASRVMDVRYLSSMSGASFVECSTAWDEGLGTVEGALRILEERCQHRLQEDFGISPAQAKACAVHGHGNWARTLQHAVRKDLVPEAHPEVASVLTQKKKEEKVDPLELLRQQKPAEYAAKMRELREREELMKKELEKRRRTAEEEAKEELKNEKGTSMFSSLMDNISRFRKGASRIIDERETARRGGIASAEGSFAKKIKSI